MRQMVIGILAHVDAGKTTLSEALLYESGSIRKLGRVDKKDAFLDTYGQERERGITIFSKQALFEVGETEFTLLDTPGHVDFSAETERTLQVLDCAVLVVSGADGVQGHTLTLWRLLSRYEIPVFLFINKMDQPGTDREQLLNQLRSQLDDGCTDFSLQEGTAFFESVAMAGEDVLEEFLETGQVQKDHMRDLIRGRKLFPCFFGSALRLEGIKELLSGLDVYGPENLYPEEFGARIFKITRDAQGNRLTHMKIMGGILQPREQLSGYDQEGQPWEEKINQIRLYSGEKFESVREVRAGQVCAVTGLTRTWSGEGLGCETESTMPLLQPVLCSSLILPEGCDAAVFLPKLRQLEEEEPELHILWEEALQEIRVQIMGQVQTEILQNLILERFGIRVEFGPGNIVYKETIEDTVEGVGHFEPLRHYAEVHLLLEPGEPGSGMQFLTDVSEDDLDRNWQRLILTHLEEREHPGVLIGAPVTDMRVTLKAGRAHNKHTEGGDFRQATYRAMRQGLMQAKSVLLEPWYEFSLEVPESVVGRAMTDLERMQGSFRLVSGNKGGDALLTGAVPMALIQDYQKEVAAYTGGKGRLFCSMKGYFPCHNTREVLDNAGYDPLSDVANPAGSVFCAHGAGFLVEWDQVPRYMHLESCLPGRKRMTEEQLWEEAARRGEKEGLAHEEWIDPQEVDAILSRTLNANRKSNKRPQEAGWKRRRAGGHGNGSDVIETGSETQVRTWKPREKKDEYLLVDGYNIIYAWDELKQLAQINLDGARGRLLDILCNYQAIRGCSLIAVFDAYRLAGHPTETLDYHNIHVVYTKEAETADQYIEKFAYENRRKYDITVATSDGLEQIIITGEGCRLISARELEEEIKRASRELLEAYENNKDKESVSSSVSIPENIYQSDGGEEA